MTKQTLEMIQRVTALGIDSDHAWKLRRISMTLQRWGELECGNGNDHCSYAIERDETTDKPFMVYHPNNGESHRTAIPDREKGALKRLGWIMAHYPELIAYHQGDPRGAALYILRKSDVREGESIDAVYNRGVAIYK